MYMLCTLMSSVGLMIAATFCIVAVAVGIYCIVMEIFDDWSKRR